MRRRRPSRGLPMADEGKLHRAKQRGLQAQALLDNELMQEAFKGLEASYIKAWGESDAAEVAARENLWRAVQILGDVRRHLLKIATNGKIAQRELSDLENRFRPRAA